MFWSTVHVGDGKKEGVSAFFVELGDGPVSIEPQKIPLRQIRRFSERRR
jgi:hypothetical protein